VFRAREARPLIEAGAAHVRRARNALGRARGRFLSDGRQARRPQRGAVSAPDKSETPYRTNAQIAESIPPLPKQREPWPTGRKAVVWLGMCLVGLDASAALASWGRATVHDFGIAGILHFVVLGFVGTIFIVEKVRL